MDSAQAMVGATVSTQSVPLHLGISNLSGMLKCRGNYRSWCAPSPRLSGPNPRAATQQSSRLTGSAHLHIHADLTWMPRLRSFEQVLRRRGSGNFAYATTREHSFMVWARKSLLNELQSIREEAEPDVALEYERPLQIVLYPDPRLRAKNRRISSFDDKLQQLVEEMFDVMYKTDGVGLSAPQVGVNVQVMVYNPEGERGRGQEYVLVNPKIVKYGKKTEDFVEGCLSFPSINAPIERPITVRIDAQDMRGKKFSINLKDFQARVFQHEYDHLEGILYFERMRPDVLDSVRMDLMSLEQAYERRTGSPAPERISDRK